MPQTALDLTQGITEYSSRIALKSLFSQFGEVTACWIPPLEHRTGERAYVKFGTTAAAKAALDASNAGALFLDGTNLRAEWRLAPSRTQDSRDFEARGSNLMTSRDLMRAQRKAQVDRDDIKRQMRRQLEEREKNRDRKKERDKSKGRDRSRDRDRKRKSRSRSKSKKRKKSRSKSRSKSKKRSRSSKSKSKSKSRSRSRRRREKSAEPARAEVVAIEDNPEFTEDGGTSAVL